jgi:hypothetical protein
MLLVVVSLLNAAATVVYVNKEQTTDEDYRALLAKNESLGRDIQVATADAGTARAQLVSQQQLAASEAAARQAAMDKATADLAAKSAENNQLLRNNEAQEANVQGLNAQLAIALQTNKDQTQSLNDLRDANNKLVQSQADSDAAVSRQRELAETYGRQVEYLQEQLKKSQDLVKSYSTVIDQNHLTVPAEPSAVSFSGPPVSGTVQDKQLVNGVTYLTISVGSADNVQPGMEFRVVDAQAQPHQFLGILTITQADANSSVGRLLADSQSADKIQKGNEVTSDAR